MELVNVGKRYCMLHLFLKCSFLAFTFRSLQRWVLGMSLPRRMNRYDFLYWLIALWGLNYLGSFYLYTVFSPLDTHNYTCGITASQVYSQYPLDLGESCSLSEVELCPVSQRVDKSFSITAQIAVYLAMDTLLLHATLHTPECYKPPSAQCAHVLCGRLTYCVCMMCHRITARWCGS